MLIFLLIAVSMCLDALAVYVGTHGEGFYHFLILHLVNIFLLGWISKKMVLKNWGFLAAGLLIFLPVLGGFLVPFLWLLRGRDNTHDLYLQDDSHELEKYAEPVDLPRIKIDAGVEPFTDILMSHDMGRIRDAADKLVQIRSADAAQLLLSQRQHANPDVRFFITTALTRLKNDFQSDINELAKSVAVNPKNMEIRRDHAMAIVRMAESGFLGHMAAERLLEEALRQFLLVLEQSQVLDAEIWNMAKHVAMKCKNNSVILRLCDEQKYSRHVPASVIFFTRLEVEFLCGNWQKIRELLKNVDESIRKDEVILPLVFFWGQRV